LELNSVIAVEGEQLDVVQQGASVLLLDRSNARIDVIDPVTSSVRDDVPLPSDSPEVFLAGANTVIADAAGRVWVQPTESLREFDLEAQPTLSLGGGTVYSVDERGTLVAYSRTAE